MQEFTEDGSRRTLLKSGIGAGYVVLSGCISSPNSSSGSTSTAKSGDSTFRRISFEGSDMRVGLDENHDVSQLNLIAPDGTTYRETEVATGATAVRIPIIDIHPGRGGYEHYTPGTHELVAVIDDRTASKEFELQPDLRITDVSQYQERTEAIDSGKLAVRMANDGTAPTWIYDITYREAPNAAANDNLIDDPGVPHLDFPEQASEMILEPDSEQTYIGSTAPFLFTDEEEQTCDGDNSLRVIVGRPVGDPLEQRITASIDGDVQSAGLTGEYACTEIDVHMIEENSEGEFLR